MIKDNSFNFEDITQDIMLKVYNNLHKYNPFYSFNTWFYTIAKNHCIDFLKKTSLDKKTLRFNDTFEILEENELVNQEEILIADEMKNLIESYIKNLDDSDQQISFLRFYEKVSYKNIGKITNIPTGTVKYRVHIIRSGIKKILEKYYEN
jgi:RNA polymerase sigma-70 factor (ECF subfamily)